MLARIRKSVEEKDSGFTLIELLVVMIIIGILAAIAIPAFLSQRAKARDTATKADVSTIGKEIATYYVDGTAGLPSVTIATKKATVKVGSNDVSPAGGFNMSENTAVNNVGAGATADTWCVALTNPNGSANKIWRYSAAGGLEPGACA